MLWSLLLWTGCWVAGSVGLSADTDLAAETRIDYLTFAQGALPLSIGGSGRGVQSNHGLQIIDGNRGGFVVVNRADDSTDATFTYSLPSLTTFDRFAVPNVLETPSPSQTFFRRVEVFGSVEGPDSAMTLLASVELETHEAKGQVSELEIVASQAVRWVKVRLVGGINIQNENMFFEFSEIIGNGSQESVPMSDAFNGAWKGRGVRLELQQEGPVVSGCYDSDGELSGTVNGSLLSATGIDAKSGVGSTFILSISDSGGVQGVRSANGARIASIRPGCCKRLPDHRATRQASIAGRPWARSR